MSSMLKSKALAQINKGNTSAYYAFVEEKNGTNPVLQQLDKELNDYMGFVKKKHDNQLKKGEHAPCKVSDVLFEIWNKFESRVTRRYFYQKLMLIGEFLVANKEYSTASWQCYNRYLNQFIQNINFSQINNVNDFKEKFFRHNSPTQDENSDITFRALMGHCICQYHFTIMNDPKLQNSSSIHRALEVLQFLRLIMQFQLQTERYCWLVYNGTIYMYTMCRYLMQYGLSKQVLEYAIWSCLCMENSIPLMGIKYLPWRATLYVAASQCFFDCKYGDDGEQFARRALSKINELHELEVESINGKQAGRAPQFRDATIKIGALLFKRIVFESRRKGKGVLRPKTRAVYKDLATTEWPRTQTEKLLNEMFDCSASQFLAIEEALNDSNRRVGMPAPAASENEVEILDVTLELFFAAEYLMNGGGGHAKASNDKLSSFKIVHATSKNLIQLAVEGVDVIPLENVARIAQYAFNYENWDAFKRLSSILLQKFQETTEQEAKYTLDVQLLNLLQTIEKYYSHLRRVKQLKQDAVKEKYASSKSHSKSPSSNKKHSASSRASKASIVVDNKKNGDSLSQVDEEDETQVNEKSARTTKVTKAGKHPKVPNLPEITEDEDETTRGESISPRSVVDSFKEEDLLASIAHKLMHVINLNIKNDKLDLDIMVDVTLLLWVKCKEVFQRYQTGTQDNYRWVAKLENLSKWLFILNVVHDSMCYFNISAIDPAVFANCSLRLSLVYESLANIGSRKSAVDLQLNEEDRTTTVRILDNKTVDIFESYGEKLITRDVRGNLLKAKKILKQSLASLASARASISKHDKSHLCDQNYDSNVHEGPARLEDLKNIKDSVFVYKKNEQQGNSVWNMISDLHVELIFLYDKISVRLLEYGDMTQNTFDLNTNFEKNFQALLRDAKRNKISQSLLYLSKALYFQTSFGKNDQEAKELVEKAYENLLRAQDEDKRLYAKHVKCDPTVAIKSKNPLAPVVCLSTCDKIMVRPRKFDPLSGEKVCWYRIFCSQVTGPNSKARISDYAFPGSGDQIPVNNAEPVVISGLQADEKYIFAVAAYDDKGKLIGDSIGESTDPILASNTLSISMNWAYLCQVSYQIGSYYIAKISFDVLWNVFVLKPVDELSDTFMVRNETSYKFKNHPIDYSKVRKTSPIMLRKFIESIFISIDISVKENSIYCDCLFDPKQTESKQIERLKECEKLLVLIELASWLNDSQLVLQAIVQAYGLLAPLVYYNTPYEPIIQVLTQCFLVLDEIPASVIQSKSKNIFESIQHMIACSTYYLTENLKKTNRKQLASVFNLVGRKLLAIEDNSHIASGNQEDGETANPQEKDTVSDKKRASLLSQSTSVLNKEVSTKKHGKTQAQQTPAAEEKFKNDELKALELDLARAHRQNIQYNVLNGNEDSPFLYAFIAQSPTKFAYRELVKFRKRTTYMEVLVYFLHKALTEELLSEVFEWCADTQDWIQKRNQAILGAKASVIVKPGGVVTVAGNQMSSMGDFNDDDSKRTQQQKQQTAGLNFTTYKKRRIKKYKLLIPLDVDGAEKLKMEDKQKAAVDKIYDLFPEMHEMWLRKKRLRKLLNEEYAFKAQFYNIWAQASFGILINRLQQSPYAIESVILTKIYSSEYLDPQQFLFDINATLLVSKENRNNKGLLKKDNQLELEGASSGIFPQGSNKSKQQQQAQKTPRPPAQEQPKKSLQQPKVSLKVQANKLKNASLVLKDRQFEAKDTSELIAHALLGIETKEELELAPPGANKSQSKDAFKSQILPQITFKDLIDSLNSIFFRFKQAIVNAHRGKEWTLLQNICKCMWNSINTIVSYLPSFTHENQSLRLNEFWTLVNPCLYLAADNLLDMLFYTTPLEKSSNRDAQRRLSKWYDSATIGKGGASLHIDSPMDDISSIDLRFLKELIFRTVQCLYSNEKWEKLGSVVLKFNALTTNAFAEQLSPLLIYSQHQIKKRLSCGNETLKQPHFDRLIAELGRMPKPEDLFFIQFKIKIDSSLVQPLGLGVKIDPSVHDIYNDGERAKQLISIPLDTTQSMTHLREALQDTLYTARALIHARRLLSIYLLTKSAHIEFVGFKHDGHVAFNTDLASSIFVANPSDLLSKNFMSEDDVCVKNLNININIVIESYNKAISLLKTHKERDLAVEGMHELGNIYYHMNNHKMAYQLWNEALDLLMLSKDSLIMWRNEFNDKETGQVSYVSMLTKCGLWGCLTGGILASKLAQYLLQNDLDMKTQACLLSSVFYKCVYQASVPHSHHDIDYSKEDTDKISNDFLISGLNLNSDLHRFNIRFVIASLNYVCGELLSGKHYLAILPVVNLYEHFARLISRDMQHTLQARLIKAETLINLNFFNEAMIILQRLKKGERLPHLIDDKFKHIPSIPKYSYVQYKSSKPIFDVDNLKCLETILSLKLGENVTKLYGPHIICKFHLVLSKLFVQIASTLGCIPNMKDYDESVLCNPPAPKQPTLEEIQKSSVNASLNVSKKNLLGFEPVNDDLDIENPDTLKVFTNAQSISIEFIKACLLGTAKTMIQKCLKLFNEQFPHMTRFCVSQYWQCEFKYELNLMMAEIADQCQLDYMAMQYIIDALNELNMAKIPTETHDDTKIDSSRYSIMVSTQNLENKTSKFTKKGVFEIFNLISKSHINTRLWLNARKEFIRCMFNQLSDLGKAKGIDENILSDFADFKYYCERGLCESELFQDSDSSNYFKFFSTCFDLVQSNQIDECLLGLQQINSSLKQSLQLSFDSQIIYIKSRLLYIDLMSSSGILSDAEPNLTLDGVINEIYQVQNFIFDKLVSMGESLEVYKDCQVNYFDRLSEIKNVSNPFVYYLTQIKLRLGSCLMLKGSQMNDTSYLKYFEDAAMVFQAAIQLNKVITERSINIEIELKYKLSRCLRELFKRREISLREVTESYLNTIELIYASTHDLMLIKNCYLELSQAFIHLSNDENWSTLSIASATPSTASSRSRKTTNTPQSKALEGAIICLTLAIKASQSIKQKMLLPGHDEFKRMDSLVTKDSPLFVANDILAYFVLAQRRPTYKNEIEEEVLTLAPEFAPKDTYQTYDDNFAKLKAESDVTITWTHLLNYQSKLQRINSMKNLNQLTSGKNKYRYSEFYTIGFAAIFNNERQISSRLYHLNKYMSENLKIYTSECLAEYPLVEYLRKLASRASISAYIVKDFRFNLDSLKLYEDNLGKTERIFVDSSSSEDNDNNLTTMVENQETANLNWQHLQIYPLNFDHKLRDTQTNRLALDSSQILDYLITINWYKDLIKFEFNDTPSIELITCIIGVKDSREHQIKMRLLSADKIYHVHNKLANLAAIADTALNSIDQNNSDMKAQFINSLTSCITSIGELFGKTLTSSKFDFFTLNPSNVITLEQMFNPMFGSYSSDDSLKKFLLNLFD